MRRRKVIKSTEPATASQVPLVDDPIGKISDDLLDRGRFVAQLTKIATDRCRGSRIIGLSGEWGSGKSSLLNLLKIALRKKGNIVVDFNPWRYESSDWIVGRFFNALLHAMSGSKTRRAKEKINVSITNLTTILRPFSLNLGMMGVDFDKVDQSVRDLLSPDKSFEDSRNEVSSILDMEKRRVVVLIDEVDRLDAEEIKNLLRFLRVVVDFPNVTYIVALDKERTSSILADAFGRSGREFLEKFLTFEIEVPASSPDALRNTAVGGILSCLPSLDISSSQGRQFMEIFSGSILLRVRTIRQIKRFIAGLSVRSSLIDGEVNPEDMVLFEGLRFFYPEVYRTAIDNWWVIVSGDSDAMVDREIAKIEDKKIISYWEPFKNCLDTLSFREHKGIEALMCRLFPLAAAHLGGVKGWDTDSKDHHEGKRICNHRYFFRFLHSSVPSGDFSSSSFRSLVDGLPSMTETQIVEVLAGALESRAIGFLLDDLVRNHDRIVSSGAGTSVAMAIASWSNHFQNLHHDFMPGSFCSWWAQASASFIDPLPLPGKVEVSTVVMSRVSSIAWTHWFLDELIGLELNRRVGERAPQEERKSALIAIKSEYSLAISSLESKVQNQAHAPSPSDSSNLYSLYTIWHMWDGGSRSSAHINSLLSKNPRIVFHFLRPAVSVGANGIHHINPARDFIPLLSKIADLKTIHLSLEALGYSDSGDSDPSGSFTFKSPPSDEALANWFFTTTREAAEHTESKPS